MEISDKGVDFIKDWEGCKLTAYLDGGNVWTIGIGHTKTAKEGMVITMEEAIVLFKEDCSPIEKCLNDGKTVIVSLSQKNYDALCSFSFNLGLGALKKSTLLKCLNAGNYDDAAKEFLKWCKDNGKFIEGLHKRRVAESTVFKGGEYTKP
jgi:lysozyme